MLILAFLANLEPAQQQAFPERMPALIEACLEQAVEGEQAATEEGEHKYICTGQPARDLWSFLENRNVRAYEQSPPEEGSWLSREFPLGGCFQRTRMADGSRLVPALSCTIWIPAARN